MTPRFLNLRRGGNLPRSRDHIPAAWVVGLTMATGLASLAYQIWGM